MRRFALPIAEPNGRSVDGPPAVPELRRGPHGRPAGDVTISPGRLCRLLAVVSVGLIALGIASDVVHHVLGRPQLFGLVPLFDLDLENTVPATFAALLLVGIAASLFIAGRVSSAQGMERRGWYAMAMVAAFMALDEAASLHELLSRPAKSLLGNDGPLYFAWVVPGALVVVVTAMVFRRFIGGLPRITRHILIAGAVLYVSGALGIEVIGGSYAADAGIENLTYGLTVAVEEGLEMAGLVLALYGVLSYVETKRNGLVLAIR